MLEEIQANKEMTLNFKEQCKNFNNGKSLVFVLYEGGAVRFQNHLYVGKNAGIRKQSLEKAHN